jgi:hypothetical protein
MMTRTLIGVALGCGLVFGAAGPVAAQLNQPLHRDGWILAAARAPGAQGSIWRTDLWIYADSANAAVTLRLCRSGEDGRGAAEHVINLTDGRQVVHLEDVVEQLLAVGAEPWVGAIHYTSSTDIQVWARVYSISADGSRSYGQLVEGIPTAHMSPDVSVEFDSHAHQWMFAGKHTADGRFRANLGIVNPTTVPSVFYTAVYDGTGNSPDGVPTGREITVAPLSMVQLPDPFGGVSGGEWSDYQIVANCQSGGGGTFAYVSVVDNATNDAYFVRGVKQFTPDEKPGLNCTQHRDGWILAAAHAPGLHGSIWRTDLWVHADYPNHRKITLYFNQTGVDGTASVGYDVDLTGGVEGYYFEDVVDHFLDLGSQSWLGAIHYAADTEVQVWARVYSVSADGLESYGQLVEGIPSADMAPAGEESDPDAKLLMVPMQHTAGRFRVNLGVVNPTTVASDYEVTLLGNDGEAPPWPGPRTTQVTVAPQSMVQLSDPFGALNGGEWSDCMMVVRALEQGSGAFAYASVVDNATNDAFFVRGFKPLPYPD